MKPLVRKYINREIKNSFELLRLRDNAGFMLEVFRNQVKASEFNNLSSRLKDDEDFLQRVKDVLACNHDEYYNLCILIRTWNKTHEVSNISNTSSKENSNKKVEINPKFKDSTSPKEIPYARAKVKPIGNTSYIKNTSVNTPPKVKEDVTPKVEVKPSPNKVVTPKVTPKKEVVTKEEIKKENDNISNLEYLVNKLPIDEYDRLQLIDKLNNSSEEKQMVALLMIYDFLNQYNEGEPSKKTRLMKSPYNKQFNHHLWF